MDVLRRAHRQIVSAFPPSVLSVNVALAHGDVLEDPVGDLRVELQAIMHRERESQFLIKTLLAEKRAQDAAMSGDIKLVLTATAQDVSAAALNAAAAGTFKRTVCAKLQTDKTKEILSCFSFAPVVTPTEAVADVDVAAPTIQAGAKFSKGLLLLHVTFDTGPTKTYVNAESMTVPVQVAADDKLLGFTVPSATATFNVVA
jgi:hypothetical protein